MAIDHRRTLDILDWAVAFAATAIALALSHVNPDFHTFSLLDQNISHGHRPHPKVSLPLLLSLSVVFPATCITLSSLYRGLRLSQLNAALLGLGVSLATATIVATGVKNLTGKPRPDFLERCQPDVEHIADYTVGATYGRTLSQLMVVVRREICQGDEAGVNDGFRSFPSGYATIAFAGLWYLTLYLTAIFSLIPQVRRSNAAHERVYLDEVEAREAPLTPDAERRQPRTILLTFPYVPLGLAIFIAGTRYFDFRNHGWDVIAGAAAGTVAATWAFRLYSVDLMSGRAA